ncbi:MAG: hypothetical protein CMF04_02960 [Hyphomonas sp.]|nr:hypothetical protein [Hyphomonas sp.]
MTGIWVFLAGAFSSVPICPSVRAKFKPDRGKTPLSRVDEQCVAGMSGRGRPAGLLRAVSRRTKIKMARICRVSNWGEYLIARLCRATRARASNCTLIFIKTGV